jgi:isopenicillin N synthase-like dioxygenase
MLLRSPKLPASLFLDAWRAYFAEMERLSGQLLRVAALALHLDENVDFHCGF